MPRIQLEPLTEYAFAFKMTVRTTDLNYGGHLGNDRVLSLIHEARVAFLASHGWTEMDCGGVSLIMGDTAIVYRNESFAGDELLLEVTAEEASSCGFRLFNRITRVGDGALIALVENGMICFDYHQRRIAPLPAEVSAVCTDT